MVPTAGVAAPFVERCARDAAATRALGAALGRCLAPGAFVALSGGLGAGKTTFAQGIARGMGIEARVTSPTYVVVHGFRLPGSGGMDDVVVDAPSMPGGLPIAGSHLLHVDLYRIRSAAEAHELGLDERRADGDILVVEWPEHAHGALGEVDVEVSLVEGPADAVLGATRRIAFVARTALGRSIVACLAAGGDEADGLPGGAVSAPS